MIRWLPALLLACSGPTGDTGDSGPPPGTARVVVVGSGPAGLSAAWQAREDGAEVVVLEMDEVVGGGSDYAGFFWAAGTRWQAEAGVDDSVDAALDEWAAFTGGDGADPGVVAFVEQSGPTLEWLADTIGVPVHGVRDDAMGGSAPRIHALGPEGGGGPGQLLYQDLLDLVRLSTRADALVVEGGAVTGVVATDLVTGVEEEVPADAVVVASGGFARNQELLVANQPELEGLVTVPENIHSAWGAGHPLLEEAGAAWQNRGVYGSYVHACSDFREGLEGEALWLPELHRSLVVDGAGERVASETMTADFRMADLLLASPGRRLVALFPDPVFHPMVVMVPAYNWDSLDHPENLRGQDLVDGGVAHKLEGTGAVAAHFDMDPDVLAATVARYEGHLDAGEDRDFGKALDSIVPFDGLFYAVELRLGPAKAFAGLATDTDARVLDADGEPIPGLLAAGEVTGFTGSPGVGRGFSGSVTAAYQQGRVAGRAAARPADPGR